jgi:transposase, IS5 family
MPEDRKEEETDNEISITYSADSDATWIRKGKKAYYGYKAHLSVDAEDGFILGGHITPAHVADTVECETLVAESHLSASSFVLADKGYASEKNRLLLLRLGHTDGIMHKAHRNKPLTLLERLINRLISAVRYRVEQCIGTLKRGYGFFRMRYIGLDRGQMEFYLNAMALNLKKAVLKLT